MNNTLVKAADAHEGNTYLSNFTESLDLMKIVARKRKFIQPDVSNNIKMGIIVSKKPINIDFSFQFESSESIIRVDDKQQIPSAQTVVGKIENILIATPVTGIPNVPIYTPIYNTINDPYIDIYKGYPNTSVSNSQVLITTDEKLSMVQNKIRSRKKAHFIEEEKNNQVHYHNNNNIKQKSSHQVKLSDGTIQNVITKSGTIPKDIDKAYREYNELKNITVKCDICKCGVYKIDTFINSSNQVVCATCASGFDLNDLYDWSDKNENEKGWIMCKRCHKKRGKPLTQFLKIDQKGLITIHNTCRNCLLKKSVQYIKDRPLARSSITSKLTPPQSPLSQLSPSPPTPSPFINPQNPVLIHSLPTPETNRTVTFQQINNQIEEIAIPTPDITNEPQPITSPPPSSSSSLPFPFTPFEQQPLRSSVIDMERYQNNNKSAKELKEQKGNKSIGFEPYEYEFKDKKRFVVSKVGVLPQKLDEALLVYQYNFSVKIQCFFCKDVRLRNDCFVDKEGHYICFDCSLCDIKKSGELYDWADRESDPKAVHILCKRCHKKCGKTLDQFIKLDQKDNVVILNTCRNCLLKKNYDYKKNCEFSKPSHHSIYRSVPNTDKSLPFVTRNNNKNMNGKEKAVVSNDNKEIENNIPIVNDIKSVTVNDNKPIIQDNNVNESVIDINKLDNNINLSSEGKEVDNSVDESNIVKESIDVVDDGNNTIKIIMEEEDGNKSVNESSNEDKHIVNSLNIVNNSKESKYNDGNDYLELAMEIDEDDDAKKTVDDGVVKKPVIKVDKDNDLLNFAMEIDEGTMKEQVEVS